MNRDNKMIILCGPSGSGKTTIAQHLLKIIPQLRFSVSATTRPIRGNEINAVDYYFLTVQDFRDKINQDEFIEYEEVYKDVLYGTLKSELQRIWNEDNIPVLDIDVVGALNIKTNYAINALVIFVHPGNVEILKERLNKRATESAESFTIRINKAAEELEMVDKFENIVYNDHLQEALENTENLIFGYLQADYKIKG